MTQEKPLLLLFDGNALVHRAFHAIPPLTITKTGEPVNAVYGFVLMLLKVLNDLRPTHYAVAFDYPAPTFRHLEFREYKAQRPPTPEELRGQFRRVRELVDAFGIPAYEVEGYEADDILGTICRQASGGGIDTVIVTGDADTLQLVSPMVKVLIPRPGRPFSDTIIYDEDAVRQRYGIEPLQICDLKGLKGDASDNIPGVPGVGEKTAAKLIQGFGGVDVVYEHIDEVTPERLQDVLRRNEGLARLSRELATIVTDVPITLDLERCLVGGYDRARVMELFRELEFVSLIGKLPEGEGMPRKACRDYRIIDTEEALDELMSELYRAGSFAIDTETTSVDAMRAGLVGISLSASPGKGFYIPVGHRMGRQLPMDMVIERLRPLLEDQGISKVAHNANYDMTVLSGYGVELGNLNFDTMIAAHLLGEKSLGLKALAFSRLGVEMTPINALIGSGAKQVLMSDVDIASVSDYSCADSDMTGRLRGVFEPEIREKGLGKLFSEVEMPLVEVLVRMQRNGVALDTASLEEMSCVLGKRMTELEWEIYRDVGHEFNINSPQQLGAVLFGELGLPRAKKTKSGYSTDAAVLEGLKGAHPVIGPLLEYRQLMKVKSTYVDALRDLINPVTGRVHTSFNQTATVTGRLSSSEPNLQNIPIRGELGKQVRKAFVAGERGVLLSADYSQIELRVMAHLSQDARLLSAFSRDEDIHASTASEVFGVAKEEVTAEMRRVAKTVNFGVIYGMSDYGLERATELSREEAAGFIRDYFERYPKVKDYIEATKQQAREQGYVQTILGRRRYIPEINSPNRQVREAAERMAINMPVQGTAADIIKLAMIRLKGRMDGLGLRSRMILQVHDELLFDVPEDELDVMKGLVEEIMPKAMSLSVPLKVDVKIGRNWGEMD